MRGIQGLREFREHGTPWRICPFPPFWPSKFWHGRDIVRTFLQGMPQRANHPSSPPWKPVRLHPVYRKSRERLFNWTRSTIIEERRGKKSLDIPLLAALLIPRPSDRGNFPPRGICGEESFFVNALHEKRSSCLHSF